MDIMEIFGDYINLLAMIVLLAKLWFTKDCAGISGKTQLLNAMVFTTRYSDLTIRYISLYHTIMKIVYTSLTYCIVLSIFVLFRRTYDRKRDAFRIELLILPCAVYSLFMSYKFDTIEVFWTFSRFLDAVAIVPQVYMVSKSKEIDSIVVSYVACLGLTRGCYLMHWLYAYLKRNQLEKISTASGIVQLIFYCDFFARNLPIIKSKNCGSSGVAAQDKEPTESRNAALDSTSKILSTKDVEIPTTRHEAAVATLVESTLNSKNLHTVVALPPQSLTPEEKITLLTAKDQETSN